MIDRESTYHDAEREANRLGSYMAPGQKEPEKLKADIQKQQDIMRGVIHEKSRENKKKLAYVMGTRDPRERAVRAREVGIS